MIRPLFLCALLLAAGAPALLRAEGNGPPAGEVAAADANLLGPLLEHLVREAVPVDYENNKHWGKTKQIFVGWRLHRRGIRLDAEPKHKTVQHGTWKAYRVHLMDPLNGLHFALRSPRPAPGGGLRVDVQAIADLEVIARLAEWRYDVQLYSFNAQARAEVKFDATCDIKLVLDPQQAPPAVVVQPVVQEARVELLKFELKRVSELNGAVAHELGETLHPLLNDLLEEKRHKLVERLNKQIGRKKDKLRLSLGDVGASFWKDAVIDEPK